MKTLKASRGFSAVELIVVLLVLVVMAGAGYGYMKMKNSSTATPAVTAATTPTNSQTSLDVPSAPQVKSNSDLNTALNTVNNVNLDESSSDNSQLGSQSGGF